MHRGKSLIPVSFSAPIFYASWAWHSLRLFSAGSQKAFISNYIYIKKRKKIISFFSSQETNLERNVTFLSCKYTVPGIISLPVLEFIFRISINAMTP